MKRTWLNAVGILVISVGIFGCEQKTEQVKEAVKETLTREVEAYKGAKQSLEEIEKKSQQEREKELLQ